mgnify:CR=1 FL=1
MFELAASYKIELEKLQYEVLEVKEHEKTSLEKYEKEIKNVRRLGLGGGYTTDGLYDFHAHYYLLDSLFLGTDVGTNLEDENRASIVVGISF